MSCRTAASLVMLRDASCANMEYTPAALLTHNRSLMPERRFPAPWIVDSIAGSPISSVTLITLLWRMYTSSQSLADEPRQIS